MTSHAKIYMRYFDYVVQSEIMCECCQRPANDIHHITGRGEGKDIISNLMALCRKCHDRAHSNVTKSEMQMIHNYFLMGHRKQFLK
jgi:thymidine kinase